METTKYTTKINKHGLNKYSRNVTITKALKHIGAYDDENIFVEHINGGVLLTKIK